MALDFPSSPALNQTYGNYFWNGYAWVMSGAPSAPTAAAEPRNILVNSTFLIAQETVAAVGNGGYPADQWTMGINSNVTVTGQKSGNAMVIAAQSPYETAVAAGEYVQLYQYVEGTRIGDLALGSSTSMQLVIAFTCNLPVAGTYWVRLQPPGGTNTWLGSYTISASEAATWVRKTVVVPYGALNAGTWPTALAVGLIFGFSLHCGSTYVGVAGMQSGNFIAGPGQALGLSTAAACLFANVGFHRDQNRTGIAPPFPSMPNEADELRECQRYYQNLITDFVYSAAGAGNIFGVQFPLPVPMRAVPALAVVADGTLTNVSTFTYDSGRYFNVPSVIGSSVRSYATAAAAGTTGVAGRTCRLNARL